MFDGCEVLFDVEEKVLLVHGKAKGTLYVGTGASGWTVLPGEWDGGLAKLFNSDDNGLDRRVTDRFFGAISSLTVKNGKAREQVGEQLAGDMVSCSR